MKIVMNKNSSEKSHKKTTKFSNFYKFGNQYPTNFDIIAIKIETKK